MFNKIVIYIMVPFFQMINIFVINNFVYFRSCQKDFVSF